MNKSAWIMVMALLVLGCDARSDSATEELGHALRHAQEIANIQVQVMLVSRASQEFVVGNFDAVNELRDSRMALNQSFRILRHGDRDAGLLPLPESMLVRLDSMEQTWSSLDHYVQEMLRQSDFVVEFTEHVYEFTALIPRLQMHLDQVVRQMLDSGGATPHHIYIATRQLVLADRLLRRFGDMMAGGSGALTAADHLARDAQMIEKVLQGLRHGDEAMDISRIENEALETSLNGAMDQLRATQAALDTVLAGFGMLQQLKIAADEIFLDSYHLVQQARELMEENTRRVQH